MSASVVLVGLRNSIDAFADNTTEAYSNASLTPAPGVWMAIYDPSYDVVQLMTNGQLYTAQIDANSHTVVNIGLKYYTYLNKTSNYKYGQYGNSNTSSNHLETDQTLQMSQSQHAKILTLSATLQLRDGGPAISLSRCRSLALFGR
jgi:hypothetical protein